MMWHPQTKGRATEKTNIDLEPCAVVVPLAKDPNAVRTKPPPAATQRIPNEEQLRKAACGKTARAV